jgi:hypothetical protein
MKRHLLRLAIAAAAAFATLLGPLAALAAEVPATVPVMAQLLFVQNAAGVEFSADGRRMTLKGMGATTLFCWKAGPQSFLKDPPNAMLSSFVKGQDELSDMVLTLRDPRVEGKDLSYEVTLVEGPTMAPPGACGCRCSSCSRNSPPPQGDIA